MGKKVEKMKLMNCRMPETLAKKFKVKAAQDGRTMTDIINGLVEDYVEGETERLNDVRKED